MGSVFKDKNGDWRGAVELPRDPNGNRKQKSVYPNRKLKTGSMEQKKDVQRKVNEIEYELENNLYCNETNDTVEQYLNKWIKVYASELEETTRQLYQMYIDVHIVPEIGPLKIKSLKPMRIQEFYNGKLESKSLSSNTVGKLHTFLNRAFKSAMKDRIIKYNPCDGVNKPKKKKYSPPVLDENGFYNLLAVVKGTFDEVCILLAGACGLRRGEIFGLRLTDIDIKNNKISIVETVVRFNDKWIIKPPKNETSQRTIIVPEFVIEVLNNYLTSLKVVPERICGKFKPDAYSKHFKKLLSDNDLPHIRFHDLRHFNATIMLNYGVPDKIASGRLGHSQVQTTREIYQHILPNMDQDASNVIEGIFTKRLKEEQKTEG